MSKSRSTNTKKRTSNGQRVTIGGVSGIVIVVIVIVAQYVLGIDVLNTDDTTAPTSAPVNIGGSTTTTLTAIPGGYDGGWFQLYFTQPINTEDESRFTGAPIENAIIAAIDGAQKTVDMAAFEFNSQPITDALIRADDRGVQVRVVTDGEYGLEDPETTLDQLEDAGITVNSDGNRNAYMHDKFFVIDGLYVWTGSTNITHNGMYNNNNNAILIRSTQLAQNYTDEFNELFAGQFGASSPGEIPNPDIVVNGTQIETFFEAEGNASNGHDLPTRLAELLDEAHTVRFMAFVLTRTDLMDPMIERAASGDLDVMGIVERSQRSYTKSMMCAGLQVRQDGNPDVFHHKVFIIDDDIVVMGSFNFSKSAADNNDENVLIIHNAAIASAYLQEFQTRWNEATVVSASDLNCS
ncbi:MAG TPA: phospholipase D-like domain-containing protein [Aggregatilinea sp.]|uniref:phospholipase D-like domain-containing protein n=1 Tax=Aggregatilinea sp. TaxID=2806333 RepID=UPI002CC771B8|nr:phospholipase D-like domain-containing protein [Aggregatilinea sp.]HML23599.1 phospholipase D-like domain-containing protein [Aggregatilinea sp.]